MEEATTAKMEGGEMISTTTSLARTTAEVAIITITTVTMEVTGIITEQVELWTCPRDQIMEEQIMEAKATTEATAGRERMALEGSEEVTAAITTKVLAKATISNRR